MFTLDIEALRWMRAAACLGEDEEIFFPLADEGPVNERQIARAKAVCARCPVREFCLGYALDNGLGYGVFGGLTETERRALARTRT